MAALHDVAEMLFTPSAPVLFLGVLFILGAPILLHLLLSSSITYTVAPTIMLMGPENAGKTSLLTLLERGNEPAETHSTQVSQTVELSASTDAKLKTSYRNHDDTTGTYTKFLLNDTPGHGKLRNMAMASLSKIEKLKGIVFMVDAAALGERDSLGPTAAFLYDVLLYLQKATNNSGKARVIPSVLIAANKMDLFTALPVHIVRKQLENELTHLRTTKSKALLDSGVGADEIGSEEQDSWLGRYGAEKFTFEQMMEFKIDVEIMGGSVTVDEPGINEWWWWMAQRIGG